MLVDAKQILGAFTFSGMLTISKIPLSCAFSTDFRGFNSFFLIIHLDHIRSQFSNNTLTEGATSSVKIVPTFLKNSKYMYVRLWKF